jgi:hypothetical protein
MGSSAGRRRENAKDEDQIFSRSRLKNIEIDSLVLSGQDETSIWMLPFSLHFTYTSLHAELTFFVYIVAS